MQSFYRWAVVPEWCRCLFFYDAAVFLYSSIERNDTRNFREKKIFRVALSGTLEVKRVNHILYIICLYIIYSHIIYIYNIVFCSCSFSLMFYGINFLRPASGCFLYLVSKGRSAGCARNDNSVSFHHAMFAHQCRNSEKYGINFFPDYKTKTESFTSRSLLIEISLFNIHRKPPIKYPLSLYL